MSWALIVLALYAPGSSRSISGPEVIGKFKKEDLCAKTLKQAEEASKARRNTPDGLSLVFYCIPAGAAKK